MLKTKSPLPAVLALGLASGLMLAACQAPETNPSAVDAPPASASGRAELSPSEREAFEKEAVAVKARFQDEAAFGTAMEELSARYGLAIPAAPRASLSPAVTGDFPIGDAPAPEDQALGKTAASVFVWKTAKNVEVSLPFALYHLIEVPVNQTLVLYTEQVSALVDPFLVAYYRTSGTNASEAYNVQIVGLDDDGHGGRNSEIVWKNTTGAVRLVEVIAFAYNSYTTGDARLRYSSFAGGGFGSVSGRLITTRITGNLPVNTSGCTGGARYSRIILQKLEGIRQGSGLLGVNMSTMRGGNVRDFDAGISMLDPIPASDGSFMLPYLKHVPGTIYGNSRYLATQNDRYLCEQ
jgi:hypothetical protein